MNDAHGFVVSCDLFGLHLLSDPNGIVRFIHTYSSLTLQFNGNAGNAMFSAESYHLCFNFLVIDTYLDFN